jgi:hypothetical protein
MSIKVIEIKNDCEIFNPVVKLANVPFSSLWQYVGKCMSDIYNNNSGETGQDLNYATQKAAQRLSEKLSRRNIKIEVIIDPLIPVSGISVNQLTPLIVAIGENASAAVEPGPGTILLKTWRQKRHIGVDAIGLDAVLPDSIKENLMRPGFTTRAGDWDTGLGLHEVSVKAAKIDGRIEFFEPRDDKGAGFRLSMPLGRGQHRESPEKEIAIDSIYDEDTRYPVPVYDWYFPNIYTTAKGDQNGDNNKQCDA